MPVGIKFGSPWWLLLLIFIAGFIVWWWRREKRLWRGKKMALASVRTVIFLLLVLALADTQLTFLERGKTVVFVVDQSASLNKQKEMREYITQAIARKSADDRYAIVTVGREAMVEQLFSTDYDISDFSSVVEKHQTDLAAGLRLAGGLIPNGVNGKIVLMSDGEETRGDVLQEVKLLQERGIAIDTAYIRREVGPEVLVSEVAVSPRVYLGDALTVKVRVDSTVETNGILRLYDGDREVGTEEVALTTGENWVTFTSEATVDGFHRFRVNVEADRDTLASNNEAYAFTEVIGTPKVLVVEGTEHAASNIINVLHASGIEIDRLTVNGLPEQLESYKQYRSIILADVAGFEFGQRKMELIETAVREFGVGLVMTGGQESFGLGGWFRTPIEDALPVYMDLRDRERRPSLGLMLVIDKSSSMEQFKMELAKEAAIRSTQMLTPQDMIGVVAFDDGYWWPVEPTPVEDIAQLQADIGSIVSSGGTNIYPALEAAYEEIKQLDVKRKHIILLTDGQSKGQGYDALVEKMREDNITLSTVAVGSDADLQLLERLAQRGEGRYYFVKDDTNIPSIFSKETALATRSLTVEKPFHPQWTGGTDWRDGLGALPPLGGYIATTPKGRAEIVLASSEPDPIAARWQYGIGRSVAWTSDVAGHWSKHWVSWEQFSQFIHQMVSWTFPHYRPGEWFVELSHASGRAQVTLQLPTESMMPEGTLQMTVVHEDLSTEMLPLKAVAPGTFEADFLADEPGVYLLQIAEVQGEDVLRSDTYGIAVPYSPEYRLPQNGIEKMEAIAHDGNGRVLHSPEEVFSGTFANNWNRQPISDICLLLALLLFPIDIGIRRVSWSTEWSVRLRRLFLRSSSTRLSGTERQASSDLSNRERGRGMRGRLKQSDGSHPVKRPLHLESERPTLVDSVNSDEREVEERQSSETTQLEPSPTQDRFERLLAARNRSRRR